MKASHDEPDWSKLPVGFHVLDEDGAVLHFAHTLEQCAAWIEMSGNTSLAQRCRSILRPRVIPRSASRVARAVGRRRRR